MEDKVKIRLETPPDIQAIGKLNDEVFHSATESSLVNQLRALEPSVISLVAIENDTDTIIGHILFSELKVEVDNRKVKTAALAPVAVSPSYQRKGIGSRLIEEGLKLVKERGFKGVLVLGHKYYYPRFGFSREIIKHVKSSFTGMPEFMGLEFEEGAFAGTTGKVLYPPPFGIVDKN